MAGARSVDAGDVSGRRNFRDSMQCKSFRWYLENIYPESQMPLDYFYLGDVSFLITNCLTNLINLKLRIQTVPTNDYEFRLYADQEF